MNLLCIYPVGILVDKVSQRVMLPITYLVSGLANGLFYLIKDPRSWQSYLIWGSYNFIFLFQIVAIENYFSRNVPKEVRGIMFGFFYMSAQVGRMICYKLGAILFKVSAYWPFFFIGICWVSLFFILTVLFSLGIYEKRVNKV